VVNVPTLEQYASQSPEVSDTAARDAEIIANVASCPVTGNEVFALDCQLAPSCFNGLDRDALAILRPFSHLAPETEMAAQLDNSRPQYEFELILREANVVHRRRGTEINIGLRRASTWFAPSESPRTTRRGDS
jgi:hypothetical protein